MSRFRRVLPLAGTCLCLATLTLSTELSRSYGADASKADPNTNVASRSSRVAGGQSPESLAFRLTAADGSITEVKSTVEKEWTVVCFLGTECPLARLYGPRLQELARAYSQKSVRFIGINSNSQDSQNEVSEFAKEFGIQFPLLKDPGNKVADQYGAQRMVEVFLLDHSLTVRYHGRIDDQYKPGFAKGQAARQDLRIALDEVLAGKTVSQPSTTPTGCLIGRIKQPTQLTVTYSEQIARILQTHCVECHREGEIGPFSLTDYDEIVGWGETILETVNEGRMPPWHANPQHGAFANARHMPESDKQLLRDWIQSGMPAGDPARLPPRQTYASEWQLPRSPDLILNMRDKPFTVPASGTVEYQYFVVDPQFTEDKWITSAQVIPGNRAVVHHCIVFIRPPDGSEFRGVGWLNGYVPGQRSVSLQPGYARKVPAGSKLVFQMHYTPNGVIQTDLTRLGVNFTSAKDVTHEVFTVLGINQEFEIPPYAANFPVPGHVRWFPKRGELLAIVPHMHVRGKSFQATKRIGTQEEILLDVPRYDFNWQHVYVLEKPMKLNDVDALDFTVRFDNSKNNPVNPDPSQTVTWGDQTWEEMAVAFFEISAPVSGERETEQTSNQKSQEINKTADASRFVEEFFKRFDSNQNGVVEKLETPLSFRSYGFNRFDQDGDGKLTRDEIAAAALKRPRS